MMIWSYRLSKVENNELKSEILNIKGIKMETGMKLEIKLD